MQPLLEHVIAAGAAWTLPLAAGRELQLTALGGGANCSMLLFAARDRLDRLNIPDTLKAQMSACIRPPMVLMSDRGTALASVTASSLDWHDCITGHSLDAEVATFGPSTYGTDRNDWRRSARHGLLAELRKHGLDAVDLHACVNFFTKVAVADDERGSLTFRAGHAAAGDWARLRAEQDLLVVCSTAPHPMDPRWAPAPVRATVIPAHPQGPDDPSVLFRAESARALAASRAVFA
jgi:urea carboxylase-associated protein 2